MRCLMLLSDLNDFSSHIQKVMSGGMFAKYLLSMSPSGLIKVIYPKMKIYSLFTRTQVVPNLYDSFICKTQDNVLENDGN